jgi:hypothetical protein
MKALPLVCSIAALLLASCAAPLQRRIEKNPQIYNGLSDHQKSLVQQGKVEEGMTKEAVFLSWGKADRVSSGQKQGKAYDRWIYTGYTANNALPRYGMGYGFGYGGHGYFRGRGSYVYADPFFYSAPVIDYVPYEAARVEFTNGKVSAWSVAK